MSSYIWIYLFATCCVFVNAQGPPLLIEAILDESVLPPPSPNPNSFEREENVCGGVFLTAPSGRLTSPLYPSNYPADTVCEWVIEVEMGQIIEINFDTFEVGKAGREMTDFVLIFEEDIDGDGEYFFGSHTGENLKYRSKTNFVIVQFFSDDVDNFKGFNASYESWNAKDYCDKSMLGNRVNMQKTDCMEGINDDFYKRCYVKCNPSYVLGRSSRVDCKNGEFWPKMPCNLIAWEAQLCEITNFAYCLYNAGELADFWLRDESRYLKDVDPDLEDEINLDVFPDPGATALSSGRTVSGSTGTATKGVEASCFDTLLDFSYCAKKKKKPADYAFNCRAFLKVKKLKEAVRNRKMETCFLCRKVDCKKVVVVDQYI